MKPIIRIISYSITLTTFIFLSSSVYADGNSSSSDDQWIAICLTTQDAGKATDECLDMGGVFMTKHNSTKGFKILSPEKSQSLELTLAPTSRPMPLIFGHYWRCINSEDSEFEYCEPVLVVCTDDQRMCAETP